MLMLKGVLGGGWSPDPAMPVSVSLDARRPGAASSIAADVRWRCRVASPSTVAGT